MRRWAAVVLAAAMTMSGVNAQAGQRWAIAAHGGAGEIARGALTPAQEGAYRKGMADALAAGAKVLDAGGSALDAVQAAAEMLEDDPLFNAGRGAVFTADGRVELDAAIMDGATLDAGAVAGVTRTRHPIALARKVMEASPHVMLAGEGADAFSRAEGLEQVEPSFFYTEARWRDLERRLQAANLAAPARPPGAPRAADPRAALAHTEGKYGTIGVVAVDRKGNVAAGTSTGGVNAKRWGRVGDSPIIGAGTYASNASCAVSGTGTGEYFIRLTLAREVCALMEYRGLTLKAAVDVAVGRSLTDLGGDGGVIAAAPNGEIAWAFNTTGMYRARQVEGEAASVSIYKDEP
jgi:beta-aspartyl-peptidase (threonine type)